MNERKRIAVIGAGASGLPAIKSCMEENLQVVCYERSDRIGGLWNYQEKVIEGHTSVIKSTVMNNSKEFLYSDFPPPPNFPMYMHHSKFMEYLTLYAEKFHLLKNILFQHEVINISRNDDYSETGRWKIKVRDLKKETDFDDIVDGVMICTGFLVSPKKTKFPGLEHFKGEVIHSQAYRVPDNFKDKNVVIIGMGNSGCDIAVDLSSISKKVFLSTRSGIWTSSRSGIFGTPLDMLFHVRIVQIFIQIFPNLCQFLFELYLKILLNYNLYNLKPSHRFFNTDPVINDNLKSKILNGSIFIKRDIKFFTERGVFFDGEDTREYPVDAVIMATGYDKNYSFLEDDLRESFEKTDYAFYYETLPPILEHPSLAFVGKFIYSGIYFGEMQCRWFIHMISGKAKIPSKELMLKQIEDYSTKYCKVLDLGSEKPCHAFVHTYDMWISMASEIGVLPNLKSLLFKDFKMFYLCLFGPSVSYQFRLQGPHNWSGARDAILNVPTRYSSAFRAG